MTTGAARAEIGAYAEVVRGFAEAMAFRPFVLVGHSMGGAIAMDFAARYPELTRGLILIGIGVKILIEHL